VKLLVIFFTSFTGVSDHFSLVLVYLRVIKGSASFRVGKRAQLKANSRRLSLPEFPPRICNCNLFTSYQDATWLRVT